MKKLLIVISIVIVVGSVISSAIYSTAQQRSEYAGQEKREIKSLSNSDLEELRAGKGWGLAKAAELNGYPGPVHLIEMKDKLGLSRQQLLKIEELYSGMKKEAVPLGLKLIELEKNLDSGFANKTINKERLDELLKEIGQVTADLRSAHLSVHLKTPDILSQKQISTYNRLSGYNSTDPCKSVPEGHDPAMWRKHNNCG
ncbi:MAG: hypothetical protein HKN25_04765 [Pyrinomonadaceae bacterium]|nr:hypothetical protein [Pyrinomonadaceae bacterium]